MSRAVPQRPDCFLPIPTYCFARHCANGGASADTSPQKTSLLKGIETPADQPSSKQLTQLAVACVVPMIAFGFMDNFIMIIAGDAIDTKIGVTFGLSTLAAAGFGNLLSDICGVFAGDSVEAAAKKAGMEEPDLSDEQADHRKTKLVKAFSSALGISIGCILGMVPLLWIGNRKSSQMSKEELELYESVFAPASVKLTSFVNLLAAGKWRTAEKGDVIFQGGKPLNFFAVLSKGRAQAVKLDGTLAHVYLPKGVAPKEDSGSSLSGPMIRGCFIGGTRLMDSRSIDYDASKSSKPYNNTISALESTRYLEWDFDTLRTILEEDCHLERALISFAQKEITSQFQQLKKKTANQTQARLTDYETLLRAVTETGVVSSTQCQLVDGFHALHGIKDEDRSMLLNKIGWTDADWQRGMRSSDRS